MSDALDGRWGLALARQLFPLLTVALLFVIAGRTLQRESRSPLSPAHVGGTTRQLWSFSSPTFGVARLHWVSLLRSSVGLMGLLMPVPIFFMMRNVAASMSYGVSALVPVMLFWLSLMNSQTQINQFGLDGAGVRTLLVLPIRAVELLRGKALGLAAYLSVQMLVLFGLMVFTATLGPLMAFAVVCLAGSQFLLTAGIGHWTSVKRPRPLPRNVFRSTAKTNPDPLLALIGLAITSVGTLIFGGVFIGAARYAPTLLLPIAAALLVVVAFVYWRLLQPYAARQLDARRELLAQMVGK